MITSGGIRISQDLQVSSGIQNGIRTGLKPSISSRFRICHEIGVGISRGMRTGIKIRIRTAVWIGIGIQSGMRSEGPVGQESDQDEDRYVRVCFRAALETQSSEVVCGAPRGAWPIQSLYRSVGD